MAKEEFPAVFNNASNEVNGMQVPAAEAAAPAPEAEKSQVVVESRQETVERPSAEELGRQKLEAASERISGFKNALVAGAGRLWDRMKGWGGKAARFGGKLVAIGVGTAFNSAEFVGDKVSEGYNATIEKYNNGKEAISNKVEAAKQKLEGGIQNAKNRFAERIAPLKNRFENYLKAREQFAEALKNLRQAQKALLTSPV